MPTPNADVQQAGKHAQVICRRVDALCKLIARLDLDQLSEEEILEIARLLSALSIVTAQLNGLALTFSALLAARTPRRGPLDSPNHWFGPN